MNQYFVTQYGKTVGPWSLERIQTELKQGNLHFNDYIFHPDAQEWQVILISSLIPDSHKCLGSKFTPNLKRADPVSNQKWDDLEWFIFKDNQQQGPYTYLEVLRLLQAKRLFDYDYVWAASLPTWSKVFEIPAFSFDQVKNLSQKNEPEIQSVFFRRQFPRIRFEVPVFVHNSRKLWRAKTDELSAGGCSLTLSATELEPGDKIIVHIPQQPSSQLPGFNALCTLVSKKAIGSNQHKLGVKFEALNQDIQISLRLFTERPAA